MKHTCTPEQQTRLLKLAAKGHPNTYIAAAAGIAERTLYGWLARDDLTEFAEAYTRAQINGRTRHVEAIAESDDWRARAWLLERMDPKHWGKAELDPEALEKKLQAYLQGRTDALNEQQDRSDA